MSALCLHLVGERYLTAEWKALAGGGRVLQLAIDRLYTNSHGRYRLRACGPVTVSEADGQALLVRLGDLNRLEDTDDG